MIWQNVAMTTSPKDFSENLMLKVGADQYHEVAK